MKLDAVAPGQLEELAVLPGRPILAPRPGGLWLSPAIGRYTEFDPRTGATQEHRLLRQKVGAFALLPEVDAVIVRTATGFVLQGLTGKTLAKATLPAAPPDRRRPQRPAWSGWALEGENLWVAGYGEDGLPRVDLLGARDLSRRGTITPRSAVWRRYGASDRVEDYGDDPTVLTSAALPGSFALYANGGDSFLFFTRFTAEGPAQVESDALEQQVENASDEVVHHVRVTADGLALIACDDLSQLRRIDIATATPTHRFIRPWGPIDDAAVQGSYLVADILADERALYVHMERNEYVDAPEEWPAEVLLRLDPESLEIEAALDLGALAPEGGAEVHAGGLVTAPRGKRTAIYRWT
ncbi:MAG: hypothetical protein KC486_05905 [Myxococcales bacterium]|nr:hypothetical protein [Myxococcales bacterium]